MMRTMISSFLFILLVWTVDAQLVASQTTSYFPSLRHYDPSFAPIIVALGCSFLFVLFFAFFLRHCSDPNISVTDLPTATTATIINYTPHHHDEPQGIDPKLLDTFPIIMYCNLKDIKHDGILSVSVPLECAVCLTEFKHDDTLRLLPKCKHAFHPDCIKKWFASHVTCPVCRAVLKPVAEEDVAVVVIQNETNETVGTEEVGDRWARMTTREVSCGERVLRRCHSTGNSLDLRKEIMGWGAPMNEGNDDDDVFEGREDEGSSGGRLFMVMSLHLPPTTTLITLISTLFVYSCRKSR